MSRSIQPTNYARTAPAQPDCHGCSWPGNCSCFDEPKPQFRIERCGNMLNYIPVKESK